jgi:hypothetical protein
MSDDDESLDGGNTEFAGINMEFIMAARNGKADAVQSLLGKKANIRCTDSHGWTALHWSAANGHVNVIKRLCKHLSGSERSLKSFINMKENLTGWTALHVSCVSLREALFLSV